MRTKDKIEKYLDRLCKKYNGTVIESEQSRYYNFNNRILRVSNHVAKSSNGSISIVFDGFDSGNYIICGHKICGHNSGNIFIIDYEHLKSYVKNFIITCWLFKSASITEVSVDKVLKSDDSKLKIVSEIIHFSKKQINTMKGWLGAKE